MRRQRGYIINPFVFGGGGGGAPTDPYFANVVALLHFDDQADGSTTYTDVKGKTWTGAGNAQIDTAVFKYGVGSLLLDGTGDYIGTGSSADFGYGTGDFTIEYWMRVNAMAVDVEFDQRASAGDVLPVVYHDAAGQIVFYTNGAGRIVSSNGVITTGAFQHVALCRASGTTRLFVGGTQRGSSYADSNNYGSSAFRFGDGFGAGGNSLNGWLDELRVTKGVARYTSNFTPPAAVFPDA